MEDTIITFIVVGFLAQMIDGALGMAYGVSATAFLLTIGIPPAAASASVHTAEVFTTGVSGISHLRFGNVDKKLFAALLVPGVLGGVLGAYVLTAFPSDKMKPYVAVYLLIMGAFVLWRAVKKISPKEFVGSGKIIPLGLAGGFLDAIGGGGWGPVVTSTLVARGNHPRFTIGSVNLAEFFVTVAEVFTFILFLGITHWKIILGLMLGGVIAAPIAAYACKNIPVKRLMIMVGLLIIILSVRTLYLTFA